MDKFYDTNAPRIRINDILGHRSRRFSRSLDALRRAVKLFVHA
jgi:hypothetical protein